MTVAVEGEPCTTVPVPTLVPSSVMVTDPEGSAATGLEEVMLTVTVMEPVAGVSDEGVSTVVVTAVVETASLTEDEAEPL